MNKYDKNGFDKDGYDKWGYDKDGYDLWERDWDGYDTSGYNEEGYDQLGYDSRGYNKDVMIGMGIMKKDILAMVTIEVKLILLFVSHRVPHVSPQHISRSKILLKTCWGLFWL